MNNNYTDVFEGFASRDSIIKAFYGSEEKYLERMRTRTSSYMKIVISCAEISFAAPSKTLQDLDIDDATAALQSLGYKKSDAKKEVQNAINNGANTVEDVIKISLGKTSKKETIIPVNEDIITDAINSLLVLGYKKRESEKIVRQSYQDGHHKVEELLRVCLAKLK